MIPLAVALACALAAWIVFKLRVVADVAGGYKAKVLCTAIFASGRTVDPQTADEIAADSYWLLRPFRASVDREHQAVAVSFIGLRRRIAMHRAGFGATLADRGSRDRAAAAAATPAAALTRLAAPTPAAAAAPPPTARVPVAPARPGAPHVHSRTALHPRLQPVVDRAFDEPHPARLRRTHAVLVVHDGEVIAERYARGVGADTPLPGWSMAKSVLSAMVGLLVADGRLRLDQRELKPEWRAPDPRAAITLEDLLRMRSGLAFSESYSNPWSDVLHMLFNCPDAAGYAASRRLAAPPGTVWTYSSGTSNILSAIVRDAVGSADYPTWPRRALFDPLQMRSAVLEPDASGTFVCSSFMLATARDWARYGELWLNGGRWSGREFLTPEWVRFSTTPTPQSPEGRFGAHWWLKLNPEIGGNDAAANAIAPDAFFAIGHEGQTLTVIPSRRLVVVRLGAAIYIDAWNQAEFIAAIQDAL